MTSTKTQIVDGYVESDVMLTGKTVVITGANTGLGYETCLDIAKRGARIIMACRDMERAKTAKDKLLIEVRDADILIKKLDLASMESIRECAKDINENESRLDILINNAGIMMCPKWETKDGFEMQLGVNHIGHFLFTNLLLNLLKERTSLLYIVHPGYIHTDLQRHTHDLSHMSCFWASFTRCFFCCCASQFIPIRKGAQTTIYCAIAPELAKDTGKYYTKCKETSPASFANNEEHAKKLWQMSEEWTSV